MSRPSAAGGAVPEGTVLWEPSADAIARAAITRYLEWLKASRGLAFRSYAELWQWSVTDLEAFWASIWEFCGVTAHRPYSRILADRRLPGARWCPGAELNYAEHALRRRDEHPAVLFRSEDRPLVSLTYAELAR
ncbi:MAG: acetoacetate--CoA ligase, partial [Bacillati bacterium ANGP1]